MRLMQRLTLLFAVILVGGCVQSDCDWAKPIRPTTGDLGVVSPGLAREVLAHNQTGAKLCGWKP